MKSSHDRWPRIPGVLLGGLLGLALAVPAPAAAPDFVGEHVLDLTIEALPEISGLTTSRRHPGLFWAINDSGNAPLLQAFDRQGRLRAAVQMPDVAAVDWEDLAAYRRDGVSWLAIGDIGDNFSLRAELEILLVPEPSLEMRSVSAIRRLRFEYEDGPRDAEALAVDPVAGQILILEKRRPPAALYALALDGPDRQIARRIALLPERWPEPPAPVQSLGDMRSRGAATAMDLSPDGRSLAVLGYTHFWTWHRAPGQDWSTALSAAPRTLSRVPRGVRGLEAIAWDADGEALWLMPEGLPSPLFRWPVPARSRAVEIRPQARPEE